MLLIAVSALSANAADPKDYFKPAQRPKNLGARPNGSNDHPSLKPGYIGKHFVDIYLDAKKEKLVVEVFADSDPKKLLARSFQKQEWDWALSAKTLKVLNVTSRRENYDVAGDLQIKAGDDLLEAEFVLTISYEEDGATKYMGVSWSGGKPDEANCLYGKPPTKKVR